MESAEDFLSVGTVFIQFLQQRADRYCAEQKRRINHIILVAHNGKIFDIPFLKQQLSRHQLPDTFFGDSRVGLGINTLQLAKMAIKAAVAKDPLTLVPSAYNLGTLCQFVTGNPLRVGHRAMLDVEATYCIFRQYSLFWESCGHYIFSFRPGTTQ